MPETRTTDVPQTPRGAGQPDPDARGPSQRPRLDARQDHADFGVNGARAGGVERTPPASTGSDTRRARLRNAEPMAFGPCFRGLSQYRLQELTREPPRGGPKRTRTKPSATGDPQPPNATGGMLIGTVLDELARTNQATGLVTKGVDDGVGIAAVLERI